KKQEDKIIIPVKKISKKIKSKIKSKFPGSEFIKADFKKRDIKKTYKDILINKIDKKNLNCLPSSYDIIGDIIIIKIPETVKSYKKEIGNALLKTHKNINTVLEKSDIHKGEFRTQDLDHLAGEKKKETLYKENNAVFKLDVEKVYFSVRLASERKRIYKQVKPGENILVMFSGIAVYPIVISKNSNAESITAIEKNPAAQEYAEKNLKLNRTKNIKLYLGDVRDVIPELDKKFDRILMPLPKTGENFLDLALSVSKKGTIIHFYDFEHETEFDKGKQKVKEACKESGINCKIIDLVACGQYAPGKYRICIDFKII
ncbi:methyltransferase domain-containing protein, partial [Candidatus Woesearchaeota archaeon]|nr:methyltransferase domain-containing protein [Candidatus Woesearchaeota archaeon]